MKFIMNSHFEMTSDVEGATDMMIIYNEVRGLIL